MRYGFWTPVFGGWLRNVPDEGMAATWDYTKRLCQRAEQIGYDLTLVAELNLNDAVVEVWYGVMAPAGLPANVRNKLRTELALVLKDPEVLDRLAKAGWVPDPIDGDDFRRFAVDELGVWKDVAKAAKIELNE